MARLRKGYVAGSCYTKLKLEVLHPDTESQNGVPGGHGRQVPGGIWGADDVLLLDPSVGGMGEDFYL